MQSDSRRAESCSMLIVGCGHVWTCVCIRNIVVFRQDVEVVLSISCVLFDFVRNEPMLADIVIEQDGAIVLPRVFIIVIFCKFWVRYIFAIRCTKSLMRNFIYIACIFCNDSVVDVAVISNQIICWHQSTCPLKFWEVEARCLRCIFVTHEKVFAIALWDCWVVH